jgi:hypothetical protein
MNSADAQARLLEALAEMQYLKFQWDESRGDEHSDWGASWWYFEIGADGYPVRQIELYDAGVRLRYGPDHLEDEFGGLSYGHESEMDRSADQVLSADEFEAVWATGPWHNEQSASARGAGSSFPDRRPGQ